MSRMIAMGSATVARIAVFNLSSQTEIWAGRHMQATRPLERIEYSACDLTAKNLRGRHRNGELSDQAFQSLRPSGSETVSDTFIDRQNIIQRIPRMPDWHGSTPITQSQVTEFCKIIRPAVSTITQQISLGTTYANTCNSS